MELLANTDMLISEIALSCDFNNIGYFHRAFHNKYNYTPGRMRNILQQNRFPYLLKEYRQCYVPRFIKSSFQPGRGRGILRAKWRNIS